MIPTDPETIRLALGAFLLPFISFLIQKATPVRYKKISPTASTIILFFSTVLSTLLLINIFDNGPVSIAYPWFSLGTWSIEFNLTLNTYSAAMVLMVSCISFLVHLYSISYMAGEPRIQDYFGMLGFFTFSMLGIILSGNLLVTFVFWEWVGFSSYILIGFWRERPAAIAAATKAFLMNRIGDMGFLIALVLLWIQTDSLELATIAQSVGNISPSDLNIIGFCIFVGVVGKSAQFPLFTWLPDAMEGPTPVSALIHAATMVAAGVFLMCRISFLFTPDILILIAVTGSITALWGAVAAMVHFDVKKILAYSTISQLGMMVMCIGSGDPNAAYLHLLTHAFFKASLFLAGGAVFYLVSRTSRQSNSTVNLQDIRYLGGLSLKMPFVFFVFTLSSASLAGLPLFSGFISKEAMLTSIHSPFFLGIGIVTSILTIIYTFRLTWYVFMSKRATVTVVEDHHYPSLPMTMKIPLGVLGAASTWIIVSLNPFEPQTTITYLSAIATLAIAICAYLFYRTKRAPFVSDKSSFVVNHLGLDRLYTSVVMRSTMLISGATNYIDKKWLDSILHSAAYVQVTIAHLAGWCDKMIIDGFVNGVGNLSKTVGNRTRALSNGNIQSYILWATVGLIGFMTWILFT